jgi:7-cyano-7-deazaguanine synthase
VHLPDDIFKISSLVLSSGKEIPITRGSAIPSTYVPARNIIFLSIALAYAETVEATHIFIGVNAVDYSGYPDCRPQFIEAFQKMVMVGTKSGVEGNPIIIEAPLINMTKAEIIALGTSLGVDYSLTSSCYNPSPEGKPCGICDSCMLRKKGFEQAGYEDPAIQR